MTSDPSTVLVQGPWEHRFVPANAARFHVALAGPDDRDAPLVVLLHGFPQFWWAWRRQLVALADAGFRVAAMDLRGTGASDKPPQGYDVPTLAGDVAGMVRSLGADRAVVVGHGTGGSVAWAMPALQPAVTRAVGALSSPHPCRLHATLARSARPGPVRHLAFAQLPGLPERAMADGDLVERVLREWSGPGWPDAETAAVYRSAAGVPFAAHSQMEQLRWLVRSTPRADGRRYLSALDAPITVPVLQLHGALDRCLPVTTARLSGAQARLAAGPYRFGVVAGAGHFLPEEAPDRVTELLRDWLHAVTGSGARP